MDDKAQVSTEYLILLTVALVLAGIISILSFNLMGLKDSIKSNVDLYTNRAFQLTSD